MDDLINLKQQFLTDNDDFLLEESFPPGTFGHLFSKNKSTSKQLPHFVLVGLNELRGSSLQAGIPNPAPIRRQLYRLYLPQSPIRVEDWGYLRSGKTLTDTQHALQMVTEILLKYGIQVIYYGGGHHLTYGQFLGLKQLPHPVSLAVIDSKINLKLSKNLTATSFLSKLVSEQGEHLFNISVLGVQRYLFSQKESDLMEKLFFDLVRLGELRENISQAEPYLRDSELISIDLGAVKHSDAPGVPETSVNGFHSEEICQIAWYAGNSDKAKIIGLHEFEPGNDHNDLSAQLAAQIIWHVIDGKANYLLTESERKKKDSKSIYELDVLNHKITFVHDERDQKWWMEIPAGRAMNQDLLLVACSETDYHTAKRGEVPDRWWKLFQRLS